jgi:iron complex outermembrane recepter protein
MRFDSNGKSSHGLVAQPVAPLAVAVAAVLGFASPSAVAQEGSGALEEIVVTARFREEGMQTTPIAISAFTGEELQVRSIENVEDLGNIIPNAFFRRNASNFGPNNTIGLRGLNQVDFSYSFEPTVGLYIDDVYHSTVTGSDMDLLDLERAEVLRGPQGTLFGKNSLGGSIRLISRKPAGDNTGSVQATVGSFDRLDVRAVGDFAVSERVYTRIMGMSRQREGHGASLDFACEMVRRGTPELAGIGDGVVGAELLNAAAPPLGLPVYGPVFGEVGSPEDNAFSVPMARDPRQGNCELGKLGGSQSTAGRVMFRILPTDRLEFNVTGYRSSSRDDPNVDTQLTRRGGLFDTAYDLGVVLPAYGIRYTVDDRFVTGNPYTNYATFGNIVTGASYPRDATMDARGISLVMDYEIGNNVMAKLILADREYDSEWTNDSDRSPFGLIQTHYLQEHEQFQAELQFNGLAAGGRLGWTTGIFYFDSSSRAYNTTEFAAFDFTGLLPNFVADDLYSTDNKSAFVHVTYDITDRFSVSGGLRYTDESKTNTFQHFGQIVVPEPLRFGASRTDWKASLEYRATDNVFLYTQAATGFTSEGATPRIFTIGQLRAIPGEELISYEIGAKMDFLGNRLRLNTALYYSDYDPRSIQVGGVSQCDDPMDPDPFPYRLAGGNCPEGTALAGTTGLAWFFYDNVPGKLQGFELELTAAPIDGLLITYSAGQNSYKNDNLDIATPTYRHPKFRSQPEWNMSAGVQYGIGLGSGGRVTPRLDAFYQSVRHNGPAGARPGIHGVVANVCPQQCLPAYTTYNARVTYESPDGEWRVSLAGTNITDKFYWQQVGPAVAVNATTGVVNPVVTDRSGVASRPREWSLNLEKRF